MITDVKTLNRLVKEHKDLHTKIDNLLEFITSDDYLDLTCKEKFYLNVQLHIMKMYHKILVKRVELNNKLVEDAKDKED